MVRVRVFILPLNRMLAKFANQHYTWNLDVTGELHGSVLGGGGCLGFEFLLSCLPCLHCFKVGGSNTRGCSVQIVSVPFSSRRTLLFHKKTGASVKLSQNPH